LKPKEIYHGWHGLALMGTGNNWRTRLSPDFSTMPLFIILNPEEETHAKDAMDTKEGTNEKYSTHHQGDTFSIQSFVYLSALACFAPFA